MAGRTTDRALKCDRCRVIESSVSSAKANALRELANLWRSYARDDTRGYLTSA